MKTAKVQLVVATIVLVASLFGVACAASSAATHHDSYPRNGGLHYYDVQLPRNGGNIACITFEDGSLGVALSCGWGLEDK